MYQEVFREVQSKISVLESIISPCLILKADLLDYMSLKKREREKETLILSQQLIIYPVVPLSLDIWFIESSL